VTYNIQVGIQTEKYQHYVTRGWQHVLPHNLRSQNLDRMAQALKHFDVVALQETDGGSYRSGFINQVEYLADKAEFPYWYQQRNRNLGRLGQHGNGLLTRIKPEILEDHKLPGLMPGRGAIIARFALEHSSLLLIVVHLSLGSRAQNQQLHYLHDLIKDADHAIVMGDMNSHLTSLLEHSSLKNCGLRGPERTQHSFPSWRPVRSLDHILVSRDLKIDSLGTLDMPISDHLPVAMDIILPEPLIS
jgi:endonuclease/exonuclease/phosphatase family metal-dependent hydrolase